MTVPLFPTLAGQGWSVHKKPKWDTRVVSHITGREARAAKYAQPMWEFELTFESLDMTVGGSYGSVGAQTMQVLAGFFLQCQGRANPFVYVDPTDPVAFGAPVATADGVATSFQLSRVIGEYTEQVSALIAVYSIYFNGNPVFGWVAQQPNLITFATPPPAGTVITADFKYGYACRFSEDVEDFEEFMTMLSTVNTLNFQSVRDVVPMDIVALRTIVIQPSDSPAGDGVMEFCAPDDWNNAYNRIIAIGGGASGGYGAGAIGGGGGAYTYRDNIQLAKGQCVPIVTGRSPGGATGGGKNAINGYPTTFGSPGDSFYVYADYAGSVSGPPGGGGILNSDGGQAGRCIPGPPVATSGGSGKTFSAWSDGANGGGGAGGPFGNGGDGGSCYTNNTQSGAGGGGADGGATALDPPAAGYQVGLITDGWGPPTAGGAARDGTPGGAPGRIDTNPATGVNGPGGPGVNGSGGGGGGGGLGGVNGSDGHAMYGFGDGGAGSTEPLWFFEGTWYGPGSGGGGHGGINSLFGGGFGGAGGNGGKFGGGGGGGGGGGSSVDGNGGRYSGAGGVGGLVIIYLALEISG